MPQANIISQLTEDNNNKCITDEVFISEVDVWLARWICVEFKVVDLEVVLAVDLGVLG